MKITIANQLEITCAVNNVMGKPGRKHDTVFIYDTYCVDDFFRCPPYFFHIVKSVAISKVQYVFRDIH